MVQLSSLTAFFPGDFFAGAIGYADLRRVVLAALGAGFTRLMPFSATDGFFFARGSFVGLHALAKGVHEVDDLAGFGRCFLLRDGRVFDLGFDEFLDGGFVFVGEFFGVELCGFAFDELFG